MNNILIIGVAGAGLAALYYFYRPKAATVVTAQPPMLPATQNPRDANAFCKQVVGTAATAVASYYGGAVGGAAAQKTGASAGAGVGVCAAVSKVEDTQLRAVNYIASQLPDSVANPFKTATDSAIKTANPFYVAEHPVDAAKNAAGAIKQTVASVASTISSWF